jgi:hypothetical protein
MPVIRAQVIPAQWLSSSNDFQARILRAGLSRDPPVVGATSSPWGLSHTPPMHQLLDVLDAAPEVGALVANALTKHRESKLDLALRTRTAVAGEPNVGDGAALLAVLLARAVHFDANKPVPVDVLEELGAEGVVVGQALKNALEAFSAGTLQRLPTPPTSGHWTTQQDRWVEQQLTLREKIDRLCPSSECDRVLAALCTPAVVVDVVEAPTAAKAARVTGAASLSAAAAVTLPDGISTRVTSTKLLEVLGYGAGGALQIAARELAGAPGLLNHTLDGVGGFMVRRGQQSLGAALSPLVRQGASNADPAVVAAALVQLLARYPSSTTNQVDWPRFCRDFGAVGTAIARSLNDAAALGTPARPNYTFASRVIEELRLSMPAHTARPLIDVLVRDSGLVPKQLAVLDVVKDRVPHDAVAGRGLVAVQHLFPTIVPMIEAMIEKGMDPSQMFILGTPYASNPLVASYLRTLGVNVMVGSDTGGNTRGFEEHRIGEVHRFLNEVVRTAVAPANGWKLLDDGGMLQTIIAGQKPVPDSGASSTTLQQLFDPTFTDAVEQTTRGLTELKKQPIAYRTVAVASSAPKQREGDVVGWALAEALLLESTQASRLSDQARVGVVSAGTIGINTAKHLRAAGFDVELVDTKAEARARATTAGFVAHDSVDRISDHVDVILSCTGHTSLRGDMLKDFDGALMSGSSAAIEFDAVQIDSHRSEGITILNRGRPANFHGDGYENLTAENIALTRALLFAAVVQDVSASAPGLVELDPALGTLAENTWDARGGPQTPVLDRTAASPRGAAQRPDLVVGAARHDEWMAYLARLPRGVCPPPNQVGERPGLYIFADDDGQVRAVDTSRGDVVGAASLTVTLPSVPRSLVALTEPEANAWYVDGVDASTGRKWFSMIERATSAFTATPAQPFDRRVAVRDVGAATSIVVEVGSTLQRSFPGTAQLETLTRKGTGPALYVSAAEQVVVEVQRTPARLFVHDVHDTTVGRHFAQIRLPRSVVEVEAVQLLPASETPLVVGRAADGALVLTPLVPGGDARAVRLPHDAVFRGVHRPDPERPFHVVIDYTLPGDAVELESLRHAPLMLG